MEALLTAIVLGSSALFIGLAIMTTMLIIVSASIGLLGASRYLILTVRGQSRTDDVTALSPLVRRQIAAILEARG